MKVFKIECEWEMSIAQGTFKKRCEAQKVINEEDWEGYTGYTLQEVKENRLVRIVEVDIK